jgi:FlaG/FlaF family flagellin (archaellin)
MVNSKKAISDIVSTVLIIMLAVVAVGIIGIFLIPLIRDSLAFSGAEVDLIIMEAVYDESKNSVFLAVSRGSDDYNLSKILFILSGSGKNSESFEVKNNLISSGTIKTYQLEGIESSLDIASITPFISIKGREKKLSISSEVQIVPRTWASQGTIVSSLPPSPTKPPFP